VNAPADTTNAAGGAMRLLNFGCGRTYHRDWTNLDTLPVSPEVIPHDLRQAFPFDDAAFDAVYGSHVLEHLEPAAARRLLQECFRILRPGGIIRIVVPDLESIARLYVSSLEGAVDGDRESELRYDWLMLELYDQAVRKVSGGNMAAYLAENMDRKTSTFAMERIGYEGTQAVDSALPGFSITSRILRRLRTVVESMRRMAVIASAIVFLGRRGAAAVREGLFRDSGEVHQWMYDRFSMARALAQIGFESIRRRSAGESDIPGFANSRLEVIDGIEYKPDSLYIEGRKAATSDLSRSTRLAAH
jgi:predicted SAM-dependent methyltransferase